MQKGQDQQIDTAEMARVYGEVATRASKIFGEYLERQSKGTHPPIFDEFGIGKAFMDLWASWLANPYQLARTQIDLFRDYLGLWQQSWLKVMGMPSETVAQPASGDNRFRGEDWQNHFLFDFLKQSYLITARHVHDAVAGVDALPPEARKKVDFFTRQYVDALAPTNFAATNPAVVKETLASGGMNLLKGLNNLLKDLEAGDGQLRIKMVDDSAFRLGENVATAPGKVVLQTDLMQLIQYAPTTDTVLKEPLLIIPPWINKFYILDLREKNSFIRWAVSQGHTVYVISWVNPDAKLAQKGFEDYMLEGPLAAIDAIEKACADAPRGKGKRAAPFRVNLIGYCLGGTLLGATLGYMEARNDKRANTATFFVSLLDFSIPGELGVFIDEAQVAGLEKKMNARGYLEGAEMAQTFNLLRANDLIWSFVINNYLLGREPMPFDLLYWNADSTRMPARMHSFYLRNMYLANKLREPGGISLCDTPIDLSSVKIPAYFISTAEDHIAPWKSTYKGARALGGPVRFVLGGSGHIAGIVNPPAANKYGYWTNPDMPEDPDAWRASADENAGSWWPDWNAWVASHSTPKRVPARQPGVGALKAIEDAPGSYVKLRLAATKAPKG
jgi:polyhydroxyalkanoate synthase